MANNDFRIQISAVDKATAVVRKINASMDKMVSPVTNFQKSLASLKNEVGLNIVAKGMQSIGKAAKSVAESVMSIATPMAALIGIGTIGGIVALVTEWGKLGFQITNTANIIGISTGQLQGLSGAASLAGVAAGELDSALVSVGDTLQGAVVGRNQGAMMMMNKLSISVHRLKDGSVDAAQGLMDISRAMQGQTITSQRLIAGTFGVSALLPLLQKGPAAITAFQKKYEELAGVMSGPALEAASDFRVKMILLHGAIDGLKNRISEQLIPVMSPLVEQFTNWIAANRELISQKVGEWAQNLVEWVKKMYASFKNGEFDSTIQDLKDVAAGFATVARAITSAVEAMSKLNKIPLPGAFGVVSGYRNLRNWISPDSGGSREAGGTITGMPGAASSGSSIASTFGSGHVPLGIRSNNPTNMMPNGKEAIYASPEAGIAAAVANLRRNYQGLTLAGIVEKWSPPGAPGNSALKNANYVSGLSRDTGMAANQAPDLNNAMVVASLVKAQIRQENGQQPYGDDTINSGVTQGMQGGHQISVHVDFANAPPGTTAKAKSSTGGDVPTRIAYSMPTTVMP